MPLITFRKWFENTSVGTEVRDPVGLFPAMENVHLLGIVLGPLGHSSYLFWAPRWGANLFRSLRGGFCPGRRLASSRWSYWGRFSSRRGPE